MSTLELKFNVTLHDFHSNDKIFFDFTLFTLKKMKSLVDYNENCMSKSKINSQKGWL